MKNRVYILLIALAILGGCGYNDFGEIEPTEHETIYPNADIASIIANYKGKALNINYNVIIRGVVTANDKSDNFYRTFIIQDATAAIEVRAGMFDLHNIFPVGQHVTVKAQGLVLDSYNGIAQLGLKPSDGSLQAGYIANRFYPGSYLYPQSESAEIHPLLLRVEDLSDDKCGQLVRIENLVFTPKELVSEYITWAENGANGYRVFKNDAGHEITVVTSGYANFAARQIPKNKVSLSGILMKGNTDKAYGVYMLKFRDIGDVEG